MQFRTEGLLLLGRVKVSSEGWCLDCVRVCVCVCNSDDWDGVVKIKNGLGERNMICLLTMNFCFHFYKGLLHIPKPDPVNNDQL